MYAYHDDLARLIRDRWPTVAKDRMERGQFPAVPLPAPPFFENLLSICYQVSMLREEERPVSLRILLAGPELFSNQEFPPMGLHRLVFTKPRPCNETELKKLSPAVDFSRSLVGATLNQEGEWQIWGLVLSGTRWLQHHHGGRKVPPAFPDAPVIWIKGPGRLTVLRGTESLATLTEGRIITPSINVFESIWLRDYFDWAQFEWPEIYIRLLEKQNWPAITDSNLPGIIVRQAVMRIISTMREARKGGTLIIVPHEHSHEFTSRNPLINIKYQFKEDETRYRFLRLMLETLQTLAEEKAHKIDPGKKVTWVEYIGSDSEKLACLEEAWFELSHQLSDFAMVDGAVLLTRGGCMLGFGGFILGDYDRVTTVARALDIEGKHRQEELTENVGARHRSVYYLCHQVPEALGIVISQDGNARFIKFKDGQVTYWEQAISFALKVS
ncbi:MAG: hypothetical protein QME75_06985 [Deltaproteobacteria bacterium]|nr:hypothetical protein [Deltaproteobacteria bacterium]